MTIMFGNKFLSYAVIPMTFSLVACSFDRPYGGPDERYTEGDAPLSASPTGVKKITPELLRYEKDLRQRKVGDDIGRFATFPQPYAIGSGDVLSIVVWEHPELTGGAGAGNLTESGAIPNAIATPPPGFLVDHLGMVQFPYAGAVKLVGLTEEQARVMLTEKLAHYFIKPIVTLRVQAYRSQRVYIDGDVKSPGMQAINDIPMTLVEALSRAGGLLPTADQSQITLIRSGATYRIDLPQLVQRGVNPASIMLSSGDVLRALSREDSKVFVSGEVTSPRSLPMRNGSLTLNEALGESGGINPSSGDRRQVYVVRSSSSGPTVYLLDASAPDAMSLAEGFELSPKDVVYVAASPLANWHRIISQILPGELSSAFSAAGFKP